MSEQPVEQSEGFGGMELTVRGLGLTPDFLALFQKLAWMKEA